MANNKIFFRVDGSAQIGLGHLVRCMALAEMLRQSFEIYFVCKEIPESIIRELSTLGFNLSVIKAEDEFLNSLTRDAIVVIDHYGLDTDYQKTIKGKGCKLVCIDDLHDKVFYADLIINHAPNIVASDYQAQVYTQYALGLDYVLLRPVFLNNAGTVNSHTKITTAFVCFGGSDYKNITHSAVEILIADNRFNKIIVVIGAAYSCLDDLKRLVENEPRVAIYNAIGPELMRDLIAESQLAIVPSSGILQEVLSVGCKIVSGMYVENQKFIFDNYKALGAFESAGNFEHNKLQNAVNRCFDNENLPAKKFIDGKSGARLLATFNQLAKEDTVVIRKANQDDLLKTFKWASDKEIRKFSFNDNPIEYDVHTKWFLNKIKNENCYYYIAEIEDQAFGSVRFDIAGNEAMISYLVDPAFQGANLGTILLKRGLEILLTQLNVNDLTVWGEVFSENIASVKIFNKLGYTTDYNTITKVIKFEKRIVN